MFRLKDLDILGSKAELAALPEGKLLINTINAHSYNTARKDELFAEALTNGDVLIPDGVSIVKACRWIKAKSQPKERIAGWDLFSFEMENLERKQCGMWNVECGVNNSSLDNSQSASADNSTFNTQHSCSGKRLYEPSATFNTQHSTLRSPQLTVMFMGSSQKVLDLIVKRAAKVYPHLKVVTYSPPYKPEFSEEDNKAIIDAINAADPDLLWIGMTAPKQEKWTYSHWNELNIHCHVGTIGAVFDFFAGTVERAPMWWQRHGLEWLYRLLKEPKRMWRRYIIGNALFLFNVIFREKW
ncbi:WecB/TagA/CpsF family glycosyltransferase [Leyella stercorea]|uniref:WecB/TagA/CpsF family glycosyltransferase n=1 Tax=Leyella stercorea TaxID=363265 RepID=UPI002431E122|nr:WecB/TagA/CpsF family glycosyltransferase [Leyella stercorea]